MKGKLAKALMIFGGIFLLLVVIAVAGLATVAVKGGKLDKESKQYADQAIPAIVSGWDMQELERRESPEFGSQTNRGELEKLFALFRKLGKLKEYKGSQGQANISVTSERGKVISAAYVGKADFEAGPAEVQLTLIKHGDQWRILGFRVNSKVFLERAGGA